LPLFRVTLWRFFVVGLFDHRSTFEFNLGSLEKMSSTSITFYYGLSQSDGGMTTAEEKMLYALSSVGANVYSLGQSSIYHPSSGSRGNPYTFAFSYKCSDDER